MPMEPEDLDPDPLRQLASWLDDAEAAGIPLHNAFALATADAHGVPSVRFVLLRGLGPDGLRYFTNRASPKARDIGDNPRAAGAFWWPALDRQARASGRVEPLSVADSVAYWSTRTRGSQLSAAASAQSEPIGSRDEIEQRVRDLAERHPGMVPLPEWWGGYLLIPDRVEFWTSREDRLHDRVEYLREEGGTGWQRRRLQP